MFETKATSCVSSRLSLYLLKLRSKFRSCVALKVMLRFVETEWPGPGSCVASQTDGGEATSQSPSAVARCAARAEGLTRGKRGPAPKSKSVSPWLKEMK